MTIKQLIDRQLGPIDEENACTRESSKLTDCNVFNPKLAVYILDVEQSRRELLERLIKINVRKYNEYLDIAYEMGEVNWEADASAQSHCKDIPYIEKTLSVRTPITWEEIIKALED